MKEVILPKMGMAMEEGSLVRWLVQKGDRVELGQALCEVSTDKVEMELESEHAGFVAQLIADEGETLNVGSPIALIVDTAEEVDSATTGGGPDGDEPAGSPSASAGIQEGISPSVVDRSSASEAGQDPAEASQRHEGGGLRATPAARRLARELGIDLSSVDGSGDGGMVTAEDVEGKSSAKE